MARNGLMQLNAASQIPAHFTTAVRLGKAISFHYKTYALFDEDEKHYAKSPFSVQHTTFLIRKNHWLKVKLRL